MLTTLEKELLSQVLATIFTIDRNLNADEALTFLSICSEYDLPIKGKRYPFTEVKEMLNLREGSEVHSILIRAMNADNEQHKNEQKLIDWLLGKERPEDWRDDLTELKYRLELIDDAEYKTKTKKDKIILTPLKILDEQIEAINS